MEFRIGDCGRVTKWQILFAYLNRIEVQHKQWREFKTALHVKKVCSSSLVLSHKSRKMIRVDILTRRKGIGSAGEDELMSSSNECTTDLGVTEVLTTGGKATHV